MSQDNRKSIVMYQGNGSVNVFPVPMTKGKYGTISVAFVRRGLDSYEYNPTTFRLNGSLYAWSVSDNVFYTDTPTPAVGATVYNQYDDATDYTVTSTVGTTITISDGENTLTLSRYTEGDIDENSLLKWTGTTLELGDYIVIERKTTRTQPFEFINNQKHIEKSDDNLERQIQEIADKVDNALLVDPTHAIDSNKKDPVDWMKTILRCIDLSVRALKYENGWLSYSTDDPNIAETDKTWMRVLNTTNDKSIKEVVTIDPDTSEEIHMLYYVDQYGVERALSNPPAYLVEQAIQDAHDAKEAAETAAAAVGNKVSKTGDTMSGALSFQGGTSYPKLNINQRSNTNELRFWSGSYANYSITMDLQRAALIPLATGRGHLGTSSLHWEDAYINKVYTATINNGADLTVPNKSGTLATMGDVELAARSGRMLTDQGVWYAKMYSATVAPSAEDGTNYADFSQVDNDNNPIIVIYTRTSGAWVQSETITPPADYDGYVPVTSKIWDIAEQSGQQGGRVLWNHTSKEFTPYPTIISFEDIEITGDSTVIMPLNPSGNQIVNKDYVDNHIPTGLSTYHPVLFAHEWDDKIRNDVQWLRADTFSWQAGSAYEAAYKHLRNDMYQWYSWEYDGTTIYTKKRYPEIGEKAYTSSALTTEVGEITAIDDGFDGIGITVNGNHYDGVTGASVVPTTETIAGVTVQYIPAEDGHKIVTDFHTNEVEAVYAATGVAWYYIIDYGFYRFKLPRSKHNKYASTLGVAGNGKNIVYTDGTNDCVQNAYFGTSNNGVYIDKKASNIAVNVGTDLGNATNITEHTAIGLSQDASKSGVIAQQEQDTDQYKYLYFYVGEFTQTALENTAGLNAELFNDKVDVGHEVIAFQAPTAQNNYTWYRKYADGWVEMGGQTNDSTDGAVTITLPVQLADANYVPLITGLYITNTGTASNNGASKAAGAFADRTTTSFKLWKQGEVPYGWEIKWMAQA